MRAKNLLPNHTEILRWEGDVPVIEAYAYGPTSVYFFCNQCRQMHYHHHQEGYVLARCHKGDWAGKQIYIKIRRI